MRVSSSAGRFAPIRTCLMAVEDFALGLGVVATRVEVCFCFLGVFIGPTLPPLHESGLTEITDLNRTAKLKVTAG